MDKNAIARFLFLFVLGMWAGQADSRAIRFESCRPNVTLSQLPVRHSPKRVLLVPLLSRDPYINQSDRWPEQPAFALASFYRQKFHAEVKLMRSVRRWKDYYRQAEILQNSAPFDRVIFISHGGFDGPVLKNSAYWHNLTIKDGKGELIQLSEAQPGLKNVVKITYDVGNNQKFSDFMAARWQELETMTNKEIRQWLKEVERNIQPLDQACYDRYCSADKLASGPAELVESRRDLCQTVCRKALFEIKSYSESSHERFALFTDSLKSLTPTNGLIFFGTCNPGSADPETDPYLDDPEFLIDSTLFGGPHKTYVHLINVATGRAAAGPIGNSSAEDIVNRVEMLENNHPQRFLCIAVRSNK
ncbi:MAG: hypothetical protein ACU84H_10240 [Gammaproteobacteria bacterium]